MRLVSMLWCMPLHGPTTCPPARRPPAPQQGEVQEREKEWAAEKEAKRRAARQRELDEARQQKRRAQERAAVAQMVRVRRRQAGSARMGLPLCACTSEVAFAQPVLWSPPI